MENVDKHYKKMTETPVSKLILMLGIPTTISMLITNIYNLVDTYFVGTLGESEQAATGILFVLQCIIQAFAFMLGHGSGTYVSKFLADKDVKSATKYVSTAFFVGLIVGFILLFFGLIFLEPFMILLGSTKSILPHAKEYGFFILLSCPFMITSLILNNNLRYEGKGFYSMIGLSIGGILNIIGDYFFVSVFSLGVIGAGLSTAISQFISFVVLLILYFKSAQSSISIKAVTKELKVYLSIFKAGLPSLIRQGLTAVSNGVLNNLTKPFGDAAIAAMSIVNRFSSFIMCVGLGIGQGLQPVAAFNYQAKEYTRVKKGMLFTLGCGSLIVGIIALVGIMIPDKIVSMLQQSKDAEEVIKIGTVAMRIACVGVMFLPTSVTANMLYQSIRKSLVASILSLLRSGLILIPTVLILTACNMGLSAIMHAQPLSDIITSVVSVPFILYFIFLTPNTEIISEKTL